MPAADCKNSTYRKATLCKQQYENTDTLNWVKNHSTLPFPQVASSPEPSHSMVLSVQPHTGERDAY